MWATPAGFIFGLLHFLVYDNDLPFSSKILNPIMFGDDTNLFHEHKNIIILFATVNEELTEEVAQRCSSKKVFVEISQNSQENTCARFSFTLRRATLLKKRLWHRCFPMNFAKFLRTPFLTERLRWLLLNYGI